MRLLRILIFVLIAVAAWLAVSGLRRRDHRRLIGSLVILLALAGLFPLTLWLERGVPFDAPPVADPVAWQRDAREALIRVRPTAFDRVDDCLRHVDTLVEFYRRYPEAYPEPLREGELIISAFAERRASGAPELRRQYCVDEKSLHEYVTEGYRELLAHTGPGG